MSDTSTPTGGRPRFDPGKRVNYTAGLTLGVDEFVQEQLHLRARDDRGARALHGYGTVCGLRVRWDPGSGQIHVAPGLAVDPTGRLVCVPTEQSVAVSTWLTEHRDDIAAGGVGGDDAVPGELSLYVILCYREFETDPVLALFESARSADDSTVASRLLESFELRLSFVPPDPAGELAGGALAVAVERLLDIAAASAAAGDGGDEGEADSLRRELVAWATTQRPEMTDRPCLDALAEDCGEHADEPSAAVLLARVDLDLRDGGDGNIVPVDPEVDDGDRPVLLSSRYLQEWLTALVARPELFARSDHSLLKNLDVDAHPQYLLTDGSRPLAGTLNAGHNVILNLRRSNGPTHAMRRDEIIGFDLDRTPDGLRIAALQGEPVTASGADAPSDGDVLRYDGARWVPSALPTPGVSASPDTSTAQRPAIRSVLPLVTIERLGRGAAGATFLLWFTLDATDASEVLVPSAGGEPLVYGENLEILTEACVDGRPSLRRLATNLVRITQVGCNVFRVDINREQAEFLRFIFHTDHMLLQSGVVVEEYAAARGIAWVGQGEDMPTVTTFVLNPTLRRPFEGFEDVETVVASAGGAAVRLESR